MTVAMQPNNLQPNIQPENENDRKTLRSMPRLLLIRPFLDFPRVRLESIVEAYADRSDRSFPTCVDDPSNENAQFDRVRIRMALRDDEGRNVGKNSEKFTRPPPALDHEAIGKLMSSIRVAATSMRHDTKELFSESSVLIDPFDCVGLNLSKLFPKQYSRSSLAPTNSTVTELALGVISMAVDRVRFPVAWPPPTRI